MKSLLDKLFPSQIDAITPMIRREREMYWEEKDKADRRLELLRLCEDAAIVKGWCPFCTMTEVDTFWGHEHDPDCKLAKESSGEKP